MPSTEHSFNAVLPAETYTMLQELADFHHLPMAAVIRKSIRAEHAMTIHHAPQCANGTRCFVPHMHAPQAPGHPPA